MTKDLHLVRFALDRRELLRSAVKHQLKTSADYGYLLHTGFAQMFADSCAPSKIPFDNFAIDDLSDRAKEKPQLVFVLAYSQFNEAELLKKIGDKQQAMLKECASKKFPQQNQGTQLTFQVRATPITRLASARTYQDQDGESFSIKKGAEVDVFVKKCWENPGRSISREEVYGDWLRAQLANLGGASLVDVKLKAFQRERLMRRTHGDKRVGRRVERPDALLTGQLKVTDSEAFSQLLARGVGRHRAFGFGMLLLRAC